MNVGKIFKQQQEIQRVPTYATGFVAPKTTALFFDKIWVTDQFARENSIPNDVRLLDEHRLLYEELYNIKSYHNVGGYPHLDKSILIDTDGRELDYREFFSMIERKFQHNYEFKGNHSDLRIIDELEFHRVGDNKFLTSINRNEALQRIAYYYKRRGVHMVPIYHNTTEFEESLIDLWDAGLIYPFNTEFITYLRNRLNPSQKINVVEAAVKSVPSIIEERLSWQQVQEIRKDKKSLQNLKSFRSWASIEFRGLTQAEITEYIADCIYKYENTLKKYGIKTCIGGLITVLSASSSILDKLGEGQEGLVSAGVAVSVLVMTYTVNNLFEYLRVKDDPIAYIYNIAKLTN